MTSGTNSRKHQCVIRTTQRHFKCRLSPADERTPNIRKIHVAFWAPPYPGRAAPSSNYPLYVASLEWRSSVEPSLSCWFSIYLKYSPIHRAEGIVQKTYRHFTVSSQFLQMLQSNCRNNIKLECQLYRAIPNSNELQDQIPAFALKPV
jgi:hypothetical protein